MTIADFIVANCESYDEACAVADMFVAMRARQAQNATLWAIQRIRTKARKRARAALAAAVGGDGVEDDHAA